MSKLEKLERDVRHATPRYYLLMKVGVYSVIFGVLALIIAVIAENFQYDLLRIAGIVAGVASVLVGFSAGMLMLPVLLFERSRRNR